MRICDNYILHKIIKAGTDVGVEMANDKRVKLVSFTGSTQVISFTGSTQVISFTGSTQVISFTGSTQVMRLESPYNARYLYDKNNIYG